MNKRLMRTRLLVLRQAKGWTQREVAAKAGIERPSVTKLEVGLADNPTLDTLDGLARALGVSIAFLIGESDDP